MRHLIDRWILPNRKSPRCLIWPDRIHDDPAAYQEVARHKKLATLFYELPPHPPLL